MRRKNEFIIPTVVQVVHFLDRPKISIHPARSLCGSYVNLDSIDATRIEKKVTCRFCKGSLECRRYKRNAKLDRGAKPKLLHFFAREEGEYYVSACGYIFEDHEDRITNEPHEVSCANCRRAIAKERKSNHE